MLSFITGQKQDAFLQQVLTVTSKQDALTVRNAVVNNQTAIDKILLTLFLSSQYNSPSNKEIVKSESNPRRLAQILLKTAYSIDIDGNRLSYYDSISDNSWFNIFSFLTIKDFGLNGNTIDDENKPLHCVSQYFNQILKKFFQHLIKKDELGFDISTMPLKSQGFITAMELSKSFKNAKNINRDVKSLTNLMSEAWEMTFVESWNCQFQFPNGLRSMVIVTKFPTVATSGWTIESKNNINDINDGELQRESSRLGLEFSYHFGDPSDEIDVSLDLLKDDKVLFDNSNFRENVNVSKKEKEKEKEKDEEKEIEMKQEQQEKQATKNDSPIKPVKLRGDVMLFCDKNECVAYSGNIKKEEEGKAERQSADYLKSLFSKYNHIHGKENYLVDVNLLQLFNYHICNSSTLGVCEYEKYEFGKYSIAEMALLFSKRQWAVGDIDIYGIEEYTKTGQIGFHIDITDELQAFFKANGADDNELTNFERWMHFDGGKYNLSIDGGRYCFDGFINGSQLSHFANNNLDNYNRNSNSNYTGNFVLQPFGRYTNKQEQLTIVSRIKQFKQHEYFQNIMPIVEFEFDEMNKYWFKHDTIDLKFGQNIKRLIVDTKYENKWCCAFLCHPNSNININNNNQEYNDINDNELHYYQSIEEMKQMTNGFVGATLLQVCYNEDNNHGDDNLKTCLRKTHLDQTRLNMDVVLAYFGQYSNQETQLKILEVSRNIADDIVTDDLWDQLKLLT